MAPSRFPQTTSPTTLTRDGLIEYMLEHKRRYPDKGDYRVELRHFVLVMPPQTYQHDDHDKVFILAGIPGM